MRKILLIALAAAALGACATQPRPSPAPLSPRPGRPAAEEGLDWLFVEDAGEGLLSFGTPHSDDLRLGLRCRKGAPQFSLIQIVEEDGPRAITLQSGGISRTFPARSEDEPMSGGRLLTARAAKAEPMLQAFRDTGRLDALHPEGAEAMAPQPGTTAVRDFFDWCD